MDFNKLTIKSQEAVAAAQELARRRGNPEIYPEHLLLALLDQELFADWQGLRAERRRVGDELLRQLLVEEREQQVLGVELGVAHPARQLLCGSDRLLGLERQLVEVHLGVGSRVGS